ncbi:MAG: wax ester/triacylglycerol synthase domain-containing protein [Acidimicrobiia bacterium]
MSDSDALMWNIEKDPILRSTITVVAVLDQAPDREVLLRKVDRGTRLIPRMRQRVVGNPYSIAPPRWEVDPNFDLRYHVRFLQVGGQGTLRDVLDLAEPMGMQGFDRARPLWEMVIVHGLEDGRAAIIYKVHHAITDGVGGMQMVMTMLDLERDPQAADEELPPVLEADPMGPLARTVDALGHVRRRNLGIARRAGGNLVAAATRAASAPAEVAGGLAATLGSVGRMVAPSPTPLSPIMAKRSLSYRFQTLTLSLAELKAAAKAGGGTLNDAFVAGVASGLHRYHERHGAPVEALRMTMPINVRTDETADLAGNQFVPARFTVPVAIEDPVEHMRAIHELVDQQRSEPALGLLEPMSIVLNRLPTTAVTALFGSMIKGMDFTTSNVPGAPIPVYLAGAQLERMFPFGPLAGVAVNVTLLSNLDDVNIGVNSDMAAVPDPEVLLECLDEAFAALLKVA